MISCSDAVRQLWEFLEQELPPDDAARIEEHLSVCRRCCGEVEFAEELRRFLADHARPVLPGDVQERLETFLAGLESRAGTPLEDAGS
jgi:anti-sigma factor (TIGR02949 family)